MAKRDKKKRPPRAPLSFRKRLAFRLVYAGLLLLGTALLLLFLELGAAMFTALPSRFCVRNARLNHSFPPHKHQIHEEWIEKNPEFPQPYTHYYNAQGWIETYDVALEKPPGVYRVFYVGDSFTEGCVPMEATVPSRVESRLNEQYAARGVRFEVINTGTSSYSPVIYYILVRYFIQPYSPDLIVVNVDMTDVYDDWKYRQTLITDDDGNPHAAPRRDIYTSAYVDTIHGAVKANWLSRLQLFLFENSCLYNLMNPAMHEGLQEQPPAGDVVRPRWAWCQHEWDAQAEQDVRFSMDMLGRLADYCREHDIKLLLTGVPHYQQFVARGEERPRWSSRPHRAIAELAQEKSVAYFDSRAALAPHVDGTEQHQYYYRGDMHLNPRGFALWCEAHIRAVTAPENNLLPAQVYTRP